MQLKRAAAIAGPVCRRIVVILALAPAFASLALAQVTTPKKEARKDVGKCVGVVSAIGDTLTVTKTGFTVFNNEDSKLPIDAWRIDDLVFSKISAVLGTHFNLKRVSVPKRDLLSSKRIAIRSTTPQRTSEPSSAGSRRPLSVISTSSS